LKKLNPKSHDNLFKWLIRSFIYDFFDYFFPDVKVKDFQFIDKEFISKYEALKDSLKGDLFITAEVEIDGQVSEIVIHHENQSNRAFMEERVFEYLCYAWLLKRKPVWSIVLYTDDAIWRKPIPDKFWYGFDSENEKQYHKFDVIKLKDHMSSELIKKESMLCKLLALKANDKETDPESLVRDIYKTVGQIKDKLPREILLLIEQFVAFYKKISQEAFERIKKEANMTDYAETISEYYILEGEKRGEKRGEMKATLSILDNLIKSKAVDWQSIASATGVDQQQYFEMQKEYQQLNAACL
jgi:hypothetical protein